MLLRTTLVSCLIISGLQDGARAPQPRAGNGGADGAAAKKTEGTAADRMEDDYRTASDLLKSDAGKSLEFAERSLRGGVPPDLHFLLLQLRLKDEPAASALFLKALERLTAQPTVTAEALLSLGTYVFTSPAFPPSDPNIPPDMVRVVGVGRLLVYDITADRPKVPREIVRAYLRAAAGILSRPVTDPAQRAHYYSAARLLTPKTVAHTPELTQAMQGVMQTLSQDVPRELTYDAAYANFEADVPKDLAATLKEIEKERSEQRRNERYLILIADLLRRSDFAGARALNAKITDTEASDALATVISYREAAARLGRAGGAAEAEEAARKLPPGAERAMLWLGVARKYAEAGESQRAYAALQASLETARKMNDARQPFLLLGAAGQLARLDFVLAQATLAEAVRSVNAQTPEALSRLSWDRRVETGRMWRSFPLDLPGVERDFRMNLPPLLKTDKAGTLASVRKLTDERQLAAALLAAAAALLH